MGNWNVVYQEIQQPERDQFEMLIHKVKSLERRIRQLEKEVIKTDSFNVFK